MLLGPASECGMTINASAGVLCFFLLKRMLESYATGSHIGGRDDV